MEQKHTPGPWKVGESADNGLPCVDGIDPKDGSIFEICEVWGEENDLEITEMSIANARRIVACVNACAGVPTELLEEYPSPFSEMRSQRDMLLEALECLFDSYKRLTDSGDAGNWVVEDTDEGKKALTAIAAVKGDK